MDRALAHLQFFAQGGDTGTVLKTAHRVENA
jgi:hypothetical protein